MNFFVNTRQLRNSRRRSVSGSAENCTVAGISSLSAVTHFVGLTADFFTEDGGREELQETWRLI